MSWAGKRNKGDVKWLQQVRRTGTTTDRLAALSLTLRDAALPNLRALDDLLKLAGKRSGYRGIAGEVHLIICLSKPILGVFSWTLSWNPLALVLSKSQLIRYMNCKHRFWQLAPLRSAPAGC